MEATRAAAGMSGRGGEPVRHQGGADRAPDRTLFGGEFVVFVKRDDIPQAVRVQTGITDFAFTDVLSGLEPDDSVYILPTAGLLDEQQRREQWIRQRVGSPLGQ